MLNQADFFSSMLPANIDLKSELLGILVLFLAPIAILAMLLIIVGICIKEGFLLLVQGQKYRQMEQIQKDVPIES